MNMLQQNSKSFDLTPFITFEDRRKIVFELPHWVNIEFNRDYLLSIFEEVDFEFQRPESNGIEISPIVFKTVTCWKKEQIERLLN